MKRNKIRYQSKQKPKILITLTGKIYLQFRADEEDLARAVKGDLLLKPNNEALCSTRLGEYESTGFTGYFRVDVCDGKSWCPVVLTEVFPDSEHHFHRTERPIDTYGLCNELLQALAGRHLRRTYREHYELEELAED